MKALSIRQPWAGLIAAGQKTVEVRTWSTNHRGPLLICASAYKYRPHPEGDLPECLPSGVMLAVVDLVDVRPLARRDFKAAFLPGDYQLDGRDRAWILANPRPVETTPFKGRLHLFDVPGEMVRYA